MASNEFQAHASANRERSSLHDNLGFTCLKKRQREYSQSLNAIHAAGKLNCRRAHIVPTPELDSQ